MRRTEDRASAKRRGEEIRVPPATEREPEPYGTALRVERKTPDAARVSGPEGRILLTPVPCSQESVFRGRLVEVRVDRVRMAGKLRKREVVVHPGAVAMVAVTQKGELVLVRQYRHPTGMKLWEIPAGTLRKGEPPLKAARRELQEETGFVSDEWECLGEFFTSPGFCTEKITVFLARAASPGPASPDEDEELEVRAIPWGEVQGWVAEGKIVDAKTLAALLLARKYLAKEVDIAGDPPA